MNVALQSKPPVSAALHSPGKILISVLCRRIDTPVKDDGKEGHRRTRFIRMMKRIKGIREKMWAGQTAPFFARDFLIRKSKKARKGPFRRTQG
ncbi:hypothetical protein CFII68_05839 [Pseudomonas sp. CFII68]|nr:hypothetical protein CFII68_05839 [Pseudomonas sp. CFII68]